MELEQDQHHKIHDEEDIFHDDSCLYDKYNILNFATEDIKIENINNNSMINTRITNTEGHGNYFNIVGGSNDHNNGKQTHLSSNEG